MIYQELVEPRQKFVLANPCWSAEDCNKEGFIYEFQAGPHLVRSVLTIDMFDDAGVAWHSSIGFRDPVDSEAHTATVLWSNNDFLIAGTLAMAWLSGVGQQTGARLIKGEISIDLIRPLLARELEAVQRNPGAILIGHPAERLGRFSVFDVSSKKHQVGDGLFIPIRSNELYAKRRKES